MLISTAPSPIILSDHDKDDHDPGDQDDDLVSMSMQVIRSACPDSRAVRWWLLLKNNYQHSKEYVMIIIIMIVIVVMIIRIVMMVTFHPLVVLLDIIIITINIQRPAINIDSPVFQTTNKASLIHSHFQTFCSQF